MCDQKSNFFKYPNIHGLSQFNKTILPFVLVEYKSKSAQSQKSALQALLEPSTMPPGVRLLPTPFSNKTLSRVYLRYTWCCIWETFCWQCNSLQTWPSYFLKSPIHPKGDGTNRRVFYDFVDL